ncbi:MAG: ester cyclase [Chloroflexi bacterium]|nr:ester cyclase [Chloroflexota bacterium]
MKRFVKLFIVLIIVLMFARELPQISRAQDGADDEVEANKAQMMRYIENRNAGNSQPPDDLWTDDAVAQVWGPGYGDLDYAGAVAADEAFLAAMPDLHMEPCTYIGQGEYVAVYCYEEATFENDLGELPATGEKWSLNVFLLAHFEDGLINEFWFTYNTLGLFQALGAVPADVPLPPEEVWDILVDETSATPEENTELVLEFADALNEYDIPTAMSYFNDDAFVFDVMLGSIGKTGYEEAIINYQAAQSEWSISTVMEPIIVAEGDLVFALDMVHGYFTGGFPDIPPNGNEIFIPLVSIVKIQDGQIVGLWSNYDTLGFVSQLTAEPATEDDDEDEDEED